MIPASVWENADGSNRASARPENRRTLIAPPGIHRKVEWASLGTGAEPGRGFLTLNLFISKVKTLTIRRSQAAG